MKLTAQSIIVIFVTLALIVVMSFFGLEMKRYFAPKHAEIDRNVFEETPSFVHGKAQHIARLRHEYQMADTTSQKNALKQLIQHEASTIRPELLPTDIQQFIRTL